ncbi:hypothetical protein LZK82_12885 [Rhizobium leguminosarum]|nr:hypothetical protein LZK82_12885 [Rhizobium leguminosarum]UIK09061.1 hypothetical protein LZK80_13035 [Rhizobium leguminosarum]UIL26283.1 hypothetical protein LZK75_13030 [Rhizobium leguminosarum]
MGERCARVVIDLMLAANTGRRLLSFIVVPLGFTVSTFKNPAREAGV